MLANVNSLYKYFNGEALLKNICLTIEDNEKIGLVGINGCGKTTLLKLITGLEDFDKTPTVEGSISISSNTTIGFLQQNSGLSGNNTIAEEMKLPFAKLYKILDRMKELEAFIAENHDTNIEEASAEYAQLASYYEASDGYIIDVKIKTILNGMGFEGVPTDRVVSTLSGGEKTRLALAKLLLENPNLLILDEPTNHLDFKTLMWLESYLSTYRGAVLTVSHDRYFLDKMCTRICEIEDGSLISYNGNYSEYLVQKKMRTERLIKEYEAQRVQIENLQEYINKNKVRASTANMAKSRQHMLDKIEVIEKPRLYNKPPKINLEYDIKPPKELLYVSGCEVEVGEGENKKLLVPSLDMEVRRGEKVAVIGSNGIGKTSILKVLQGIIPHSRGFIEWAGNVKIAYFEQEHSSLRPENTALEELHRRWPRMTEQSLRTILGSVLLTGDDVFKPVRVLSGGEKAKLLFAVMMLQRGNVLILDEPTNHLDMDAKEVLEDALDDFDGTIIFVSHDRYLLNRIASRIIEVTEEGCKSFKGNFDYYMEQVNLTAEQAEKAITEEKAALAMKKALENKQKQYRTREQRNADAQRKKRIKELEASIELEEKKVFSLESEIADPEIARSFDLLNEKCLLLEECKNRLNEMLDEWASLE